MAIRQPTKNKTGSKSTSKKKKVTKKSSPRQYNRKQQYGTSKLEADFARDFLNKLGLRYIYEYEAREIGRFYDFAIVEYDDIDFIMENKHGVQSIKQEGQNIPVSFFIEIDGSYYHGDPRVLKEGKMNRMQKYNQFVDSLKDMWCEKHGYPLLRIWEYDIRNNPALVTEQVLKYVTDGKKKMKAKGWRKKPH